MKIDMLPLWLVLLMFLWGEGACFLSRWFIKSVILEVGFSGVTKKKMSKMLIKHSIIDAIFLLGLRRDAKIGRAEITFWCAMNACCVLLMIIVAVGSIVSVYFPQLLEMVYMIYVLPTIFTLFISFSAPVSSKKMRKNTSERSLVIQGIAVVLVFVLCIIKALF